MPGRNIGRIGALNEQREFPQRHECCCRRAKL
jgi:hypothetical protein